MEFSAIKEIVRSSKDPEFVFVPFRGVDNQVSKNNIHAFIDLVNGYTEEENVTVKFKGKDFPIPPIKVMQFSCKADVGKEKSVRPMMYHSDGCEILEGSEFGDSLIYLKPGIKNCFTNLFMND